MNQFPGTRRRIALMIESDGPGGAEYMLLRLAKTLRRRGHGVHPVLPSGGCGWLGGELRGCGFDVETLKPACAFSPRRLLELVVMIRRMRINVVHAHEFDMAVYGGAAALLAGAPYLITMHGGTYFARRRRRRAAMRWAARHSRATVAVSDATRSGLESVLGDAGRVDVIPNGIPLRTGHRDGIRQELGLAADEPLILSVGNLYPVKGHAVLLEALALLRQRTPDLAWTAAIAGRGGEEARLRRFIARHELESRVRLLGFRKDIPNLLAAAQIFAMPSRSEGLPLALLEAMAAGAAITASRVGGIPEAARQDKEALLVPPNDSKALAHALRRLLTHPEQAEALGRAAKSRAADLYTLDAMTDAYEQLYLRPHRMRVRA